MTKFNRREFLATLAAMGIGASTTGKAEAVTHHVPKKVPEPQYDIKPISVDLSKAQDVQIVWGPASTRSIQAKYIGPRELAFMIWESWAMHQEVRVICKPWAIDDIGWINHITHTLKPAFSEIDLTIDLRPTIKLIDP